jgi:hypothetical protein
MDIDPRHVVVVVGRLFAQAFENDRGLILGRDKCFICFLE